MGRCRARKRVKYHITRADVLAGGTDVAFDVLTGESDVTIGKGFDFLHDEDTIRALGNGGARHDLTARPAGDREGRNTSGGDVFEHAQWRAGVSGAAGESVHGGLIERRHVDVGADIRGEDAPARLRKRHRLVG
jgi:hypothetical protein